MYLAEDDPIRQSGFGGGAERWRRERSPILEAVDADGEFIDIGCANGHLLECMVQWALEKGIRLIPYGLDIGERLVELARKRQSDYADNFFVGNAWDWSPPKKFKYVYSLHDCVPDDYLEEYIRRLLARFVKPDGRLIIGAYGSRSQKTPPFDLRRFLRSCSIDMSGYTSDGEPPVASFVWIDNG